MRSERRLRAGERSRFLIPGELAATRAAYLSVMDYAAVVLLEILYMIAFLALISAGLAVVFGMMRVINLAHGEFVMLGGYTTHRLQPRRHRHLVRDAGDRAAGGRASSG